MKKYNTPELNIVYIESADNLTMSDGFLKTEGIGFNENDFVINVDNF